MDNEILEEERVGWWENRNKNSTLILTFLVMALAKLIAMVLPNKYFYDNKRILGMTNGDQSVTAWGGTYETAANLFRSINFLHFTSMFQWSWLLGLIMTVGVFFMLLRLPEPDMPQTIFWLACVGLLNIYVFNIGKDVIQFMFFFAVYLILLIPIDNNLVKIILSAGVLCFESLVFRSYYVLIAAFVVSVYCILMFFRSRSTLSYVGKIVGMVISMYLLVCVAMVAAQVVMPSAYHDVMNVRSASLDGRDTTAAGAGASIINNWIGSNETTSLPMFLINYFFNAFRMMLPVELIFKGVQYLPFLVFQIAVTVYVVHLFGNISELDDEQNLLALSIYLGYFLASAIFEPDFGSWTRHEAATFPILHMLVMSSNQRVAAWKSSRTTGKHKRRHAEVV